MKRNQVSLILLIIGLLLSLYMGLADLLSGVGISACNSACTAIHNSSFGKLAGVPIGFFAAFLFAGLIWCHWRGKNLAVLTGICVMAGAETYLTVIQFAHLEALCVWCLGFYGLVILCLLPHLSTKNLKTVVMVATLAFLATHFAFFPPGADLKTSLVKPGDRPQIEVFASPSCDHCEEAIANLEALCSGTNMDLVLRPVGLSDTDRENSTDWVCNTIFDKRNATSRRLAERVVWKNEREARDLNNGSLSVPIIVVKSDGGQRQTFKGWDANVKDAVEKTLGFFDATPSISALTFKAGKSIFEASAHAAEGVCSDSSATVCGE